MRTSLLLLVVTAVVFLSLFITLDTPVTDDVMARDVKTATTPPTSTTTVTVRRPVATARTAPTAACGGYRALVASVGLPPVFCAVVRCESGFNPTARNGSSTGLAQLHRRWHEARARRLGFVWQRMIEARPNLLVAADLWREQGMGPWRPSRACWAAR